MTTHSVTFHVEGVNYSDIYTQAHEVAQQFFGGGFTLDISATEGPLRKPTGEHVLWSADVVAYLEMGA